MRHTQYFNGSAVLNPYCISEILSMFVQKNHHVAPVIGNRRSAHRSSRPAVRLHYCQRE